RPVALYARTRTLSTPVYWPRAAHRGRPAGAGRGRVGCGTSPARTATQPWHTPREDPAPPQLAQAPGSTRSARPAATEESRSATGSIHEERGAGLGRLRLRVGCLASPQQLGGDPDRALRVHVPPDQVVGLVHDRAPVVRVGRVPGVGHEAADLVGVAQPA